MITTVIFDYDGVIVNTDPFNMYVLGDITKKRSLPFDTTIYKRYFSGKTLRDAFTAYLTAFNKQPELDACIEEKKARDGQYIQNISVYPDALRLIETLKPTHTLAIVTGARKKLLDMALTKFRLTLAFQTVVTAENFLMGKPSPESYVVAITQMHVPANQVLIIEDSPAGVAAAKASQARCLAVTHTHSASELTGADMIVESLAGFTSSQITHFGDKA